MKTVSLHDDPLLSDIPEVDGFKILEPCVLYSKLGEGGMGSVYRGRHLNLNIDVAVKCLRPSLADQSDSFVQRFQREARLAASINHQNLVQVYDVSQKRGIHYLVMEFVSGETARDRVRRKGKLGIEEALRIALGAAAGLSVAHARRIVHRDVKPDNVLIGRDGSVKVSDLGLAKAMESEIDVSLTQGVMGTPQYMAPEQWEDTARVTPAADVWALGATIYFLLAGKDPIQAGSMQQALKRICFEPFPDIRAVRPEVHEDVARLIERCVARSLEERFADCGEVLAELKRFIGHDNGELVSKPGELTEMGATLVSPPPAETIAKILSRLDSKDQRKPAPKSEPIAATIPMDAPGRGPMSKRATLSLAGGGVALAAIALFFALRGAEESDSTSSPSASDRRLASSPELVPAPKPHVVAPPPAPTPAPTPTPEPMRVAFEDGPDSGGGFEFARRKVTLSGTLKGNDQDFTAAVREQDGKVTVRRRSGGRFSLELQFERDGRYTLELDGQRLEGARVFTILIDASGPMLAGHSPRAPIARGREVKLSLDFDEALKSAEINGENATLDGSRAQATIEAPDDGTSWKISWEAVDRLGNESKDSFLLALEPVAEKPEPVKPRPPPPLETAAGPPAPKGFDAVGKDSIEIAGATWAKRVQHRKTKIFMVLVPPGGFEMGSRVASDNAPPPRRVEITKGFYMSEDELSEAEYAAGLGLTPAAGSQRKPCSGLSWSDADRFCRENGLQLPSEAEWEYACRGGSTAAYAFGDDLDSREAATRETASDVRLCGKSARNDFGLADMHGNLKEYCRDSFVSADDYAKLPSIDPLGKKGKTRPVRGGSFQSLSKFCTAAFRQDVDEKQKQADRGLRVIFKIP